MKFQGFQDRSRYTPIPDVLINQISFELTRDELILILIAFNLIYLKKGLPRYLTREELANHPGLVNIPDQDLVIDKLVTIGFLLELKTSKGKKVYVINNSEGQKNFSQMRNGIFRFECNEALLPSQSTAVFPDIFTLYEQNIGLITPIVAEELKDALITYNEVWIRDAIKEAVSLNKRNWKYIRRILERWATEGKTELSPNGAYSQNTERDKYVQGRYGRIVQR